MGAGMKAAAAGTVAVLLAGHTHAGRDVAHLLTASASPSVASNVALGQQMAARLYGWRHGQWDCLYQLWQGESGWDQSADTSQSGLTPPGAPSAHGIPQAYPGPKMASAGPDWQSNPATQIRWGLGYIQAHYGTPCRALAWKRANGNQGY